MNLSSLIIGRPTDEQHLFTKITVLLDDTRVVFFSYVGSIFVSNDLFFKRIARIDCLNFMSSTPR